MLVLTIERSYYVHGTNAITKTFFSYHDDARPNKHQVLRNARGWVPKLFKFNYIQSVVNSQLEVSMGPTVYTLITAWVVEIYHTQKGYFVILPKNVSILNIRGLQYLSLQIKEIYIYIYIYIYILDRCL